MKETQITIKKITQNDCTSCNAVSYMLAAEKDRLSAEGAIVEEINVSKEPDAINMYGIMSTPVLIFERNGIEIERINGMCNFDDVLGAIELSRFKK